MGYYVSVDTEKKVLTIDDSVKPNKRDQLLIDTYTRVGYTMRFKSEARAEKARERAATQPTTEEILKNLEPYEDLTKIFNEKKSGKGKGHGIFAAKSWYKNEALKEIEKRKAEEENKKGK